MAEFKKDIINIEGEKDLVRDKNSKAILSRNYAGLQAYKIQRSREQKILEYEKDINTLKKELSEIRTSLDFIVSQVNHKIENYQWVTNLEKIATSKYKDGS